MNLRVAVAGEAKRDDARTRSESEPEEGVESAVADAKPRELHMAGVKTR